VRALLPADDHRLPGRKRGEMKRGAGEMLAISLSTGGRDVRMNDDSQQGGVVNGPRRRVGRGHVRRCENRISPAIWLAVETRFPPADMPTPDAGAEPYANRSNQIPGWLPACKPAGAVFVYDLASDVVSSTNPYKRKAPGSL